ncbi:MAG: DUF3822 family protein [Cytophagales bacterium]|nr:DUF3822 family protein [Cytophagales bacterium]
MSKISYKSFRLLKKVKDPKFEIDRLEFYSLSLFIGLKDFQILVVDSERNQCVLLEDYVFDPNLKDSEKFSVVKFIIDDHHLLLANFWKTINFVIKNRSFSFVPYRLFKENKISSYLLMHTRFDPSTDEIMLTRHKYLDFINVFTVPKSFVELTSNIYPGRKIRFSHQSSSLINGVISKNKPDKRDVVIHIDRFGLHILVAENKKLLFYNQYVIKRFDDYIRFIKIAANELNFDLRTDQISLYGYLGRNTPHFNELKKTMNQLVLGHRPDNLNFSYVFDEVLEHQYFDLFSTEIVRA